MKKSVKTYSNQTFAENFKLLMFTNKITLKEIAERTSLPVSTISTWRRGRVPRDKESLKKLAKIFGVTAREMLAPEIQQPVIFSNSKSTNSKSDNLVYHITKHINALALKKGATKQLREILKMLETNFPQKNR